MDKLTHYRHIIRQILTQYADVINRSARPGKETEVVADTEHDHYMLVSTGWDQQRRIRGTTVYVRLRDDKLWIEEDWLEHGITPDLLAAGIPKEDIVLAFQPPDVRPLTGFAVA
ncbi:MAG TPA: XisI protein [Anaerolineae bacterium]|jgi:hypothetical protein|nr:XisI protein [Anaerolineae bacterium]